MVKDRKDPTPLPVFFDQCERHEVFEDRMNRIETQNGEILKTVLQSERDGNLRFRSIEQQIIDGHKETVGQLTDLKTDLREGQKQTTGDFAELRREVNAVLMAKAGENGIKKGKEEGKAEAIAGIQKNVRRGVSAAKFAAKVIGLLTGGAGVGVALAKWIGG